MEIYECFEIIVQVLIWFLAGCWLVAVIRTIKNRYAPLKKERAVVVDVYKEQRPSRFPQVWKQELFMVVFEVEKKRLAFPVSDFSARSYKKGQKGTLCYKGNKLIEFR
ncbi:MAG: DUF2500 domain-containing protein [Ruminococcaceae bacterium]|nr:DUF2500 domain-containing protein [Oscillospiraceae bacterium]